jgi:hypothetical protein
MPGKPFQSVLIPYEDEIFDLRHRRPPYSYARIAKILREKYQLIVYRQTIFKFVKARSRGRKVFAIYRSPLPKRQKSAFAVSPQPKPQPSSSKRPVFEYTPSDRYNLHRLSPEEAKARLEEIEAEGHLSREK